MRTSSIGCNTIHVGITTDTVTLQGDLAIPVDASGVVLFAHGSGSSRHSPRNRFVAATLQGAGLGTLLIDLLTPEEEVLDAETRALRFDIELLADRLCGAIRWLLQQPMTAKLDVGLFGASTGAAAALVAAARERNNIGALVSRGGRPDLAGAALHVVSAPTLLIVGGEDRQVLEFNRRAKTEMRCEVDLQVIPGATHLFTEPGALEQVAELARAWFVYQLGSDDEA